MPTKKTTSKKSPAKRSVTRKTSSKKVTKQVHADKNFVDEGVEKVMKLANKKNAQGLRNKMVASFQDREVQDYIFFAIGLLLLIFALKLLRDIVLGVIVLLLALFVLNLFFDN